jgi:hypothetical protein
MVVVNNIMIMNIFVKLFFENNSLLIVNFQSSKLWTNWLIGLFINWRIHIKFHSKLFIMTKYALKGEIIKFNMIFKIN